MANAASDIQDTTAPTLERVRALIALLLQMLGDPSRISDFNRICEEAEALLARCMFEAAARFTGRTDLLETCEAYFVPKGRGFDIRLRLKPEALHPYHRIILEKWRPMTKMSARPAIRCTPGVHLRDVRTSKRWRSSPSRGSRLRIRAPGEA